jgi:Acetyltransferase (GNAT) domain
VGHFVEMVKLTDSRPVWISLNEFYKSLKALPDFQAEEQHFFLSAKWAKLFLAGWTGSESLGIVDFDQGLEPLSDSQTNRLGFVALSKATLRSRLGFTFESIGFNEPSSEKMKFVTLEANGLFARAIPLRAEEFAAALSQTVSCINEIKVDWQEIRIGAVPDAAFVEIREWAEKASLHIVNRGLKRTYHVDLDGLRRDGVKQFIDSRSSNTRAQLRKALRRAEAELGAARIEKADTAAKATEWFADLKRLHIARWNGSPSGSGFTHQPFNEFHDSVAAVYFSEGNFDLWRVSAGETVLGYLHLFTRDQSVYFNLSGVNYSLPDVFKPGLLSHWLVIQFYLDAGAKTYDFMVGTSQYKQSLATHSSDLHYLFLRKNTPLLLTENWLRKIRKKFISSHSIERALPTSSSE